MIKLQLPVILLMTIGHTWWAGRIASGKIDDTTPITAVDLLPTVCSIAGANLPKGYTPDGVDQSAALFGQPTSARSKPIFWQWNSASSRGTNWPMLAVRESIWKLHLGKDSEQVELFQFPQDRLEKQNVRAAQNTEVERLKGLLNDWTESLPREPNKNCISTERFK